MTATFTPLDTADYTSARPPVTLTVSKATPVFTWTTPTSITYGTPLGSNQLDPSANVPGTFSYSPAAGAVLSAGRQTLSATFTPSDTTDYSIAGATATLTVAKATPVLTWTVPAPITYGTPLGSTQLDAGANVSGAHLFTARTPALCWLPAAKP